MPVSGDFGTLLNETPATKDFFGGERHPHLFKKKYNITVIKAGLKIIIKSIMTMMITIKSIITSSSTHVAMSCSDRTPPSRLLAGKNQLMFVDIGNDWSNSLPKITKHLTKTSMDISLDQQERSQLL